MGGATYLADAYANGPTVLLAWPRNHFEFAVHPKVTFKQVKMLSAAIRKQTMLRYDWWQQRLRMQLPRHVTVTMQVGSVPCARCGSMQHHSNSTACKLFTKPLPAQPSTAPSATAAAAAGNENAATPRHTARKTRSVSPRRPPTSRHAAPAAATKTPMGCVLPRSPRVLPKTDLSPYPALQSALVTCHEKW